MCEIIPGEIHTLIRKFIKITKNINAADQIIMIAEFNQIRQHNSDARTLVSLQKCRCFIICIIKLL